MEDIYQKILATAGGLKMGSSVIFGFCCLATVVLVSGEGQAADDQLTLAKLEDGNNRPLLNALLSPKTSTTHIDPSTTVQRRKRTFKKYGGGYGGGCGGGYGCGGGGGGGYNVYPPKVIEVTIVKGGSGGWNQGGGGCGYGGCGGGAPAYQHYPSSGGGGCNGGRCGGPVYYPQQPSGGGYCSTCGGGGGSGGGSYSYSQSSASSNSGSWNYGKK